MSAGKSKRFFSLFSFLTIFVSCSFINFEKVSFVYSVAENSQNFESEWFTIKSSYDLQKDSFESIISLQENKNTIDLEYNWIDSSTLQIKPHANWKKGLYYHFELNGTVETVNKGSFSCTEHRHFYYGNSSEEFILSDYTKTSLTAKDIIKYTFSKPVDQKSFISSFSISPSIDTNISFSEDNLTVSVSPKDKWPVNKQYTWTISSSLQSSDGYYLKEKYSQLISTETDTVNPKLLTVCPVSLTGNVFLEDKSLSTLLDAQPIGFIFSKEMNFSSIENSISFSPNIKGDFYEIQGDKTRFIFVPYSKYELQKEYTLTVENKCKDLFDNELFEEKKYFFTSANTYLEVLSIKINGTEVLSENPITVFNTYGEMTVRIQFSKEINDKTLAENSITTNYTFPVTASQPTKESVIWSTPSVVEIRYTNISYLPPDDYYYKVEITGTSSGIKSSSDDYMEENVCAYFITK